jgi:hypothetical protein
VLRATEYDKGVLIRLGLHHPVGYSLGNTSRNTNTPCHFGTACCSGCSW